MSKITIMRGANFMGMARAFKIILDGEEVGRVKNAQTETVEIAAGQHTLKCGISTLSGMSNTVTFNIAEGEEIVFSTKMNPLMFAAFALAIVGGGMMAIGGITTVIGLALFIGGFSIALIKSIKLEIENI